MYTYPVVNLPRCRLLLQLILYACAIERVLLAARSLVANGLLVIVLL